MSLVVYLNGHFIPYEQATISVEDRAFLLADGIYEVVRVYGGQPFCLSHHLQRLVRSAREVRLPEPDTGELEAIFHRLLVENRLSDATIYIQVSRGAYSPRTHAFPSGPIHPTVFVIARPFSAQGISELRDRGAAVITVPDQRWGRCDIKSTALLPNVLAKQAAMDASAYEAVFVREGHIVEGSSSNVMAVLDNEIWTHPKNHQILGGITRDVVVDLARKMGYTVFESAIPLSALPRCSELWLTSTTSEIMPIVRVDEDSIGDAHPGPVSKAIYRAFCDMVHTPTAQ